MPSWDQLLQLLDKIGLCGVTFFLLVLHMVQEERTRRFTYGQRRKAKYGG